MVGFHAPYTKGTKARFDKDVGWNYEISESSVRAISYFGTETLGLRQEVVGYVTAIDHRRLQLTYLDEEDGEKHGIAFTRMNIRGYDPLP
jgi:hypothetical protein